MEQRLNTIWRYIDDQLDQKERFLFEQELNNDSELLKLYEQQVGLNKALNKYATTKAPDGFLQSVMSALPQRQFKLSRDTSFRGMKFIFLWVVLIVIFSAIWIGIFQDPASAKNATFLEFEEYLNNFNFNFEISRDFIKYSSYLSALILAPVFVIVDKLISGSRIVKTSRS